MARIAKPLTDAQCKGAKRKDKRYCLYDGNGLVLEIMQSGRKYWRFEYKLNSKKRKITIGQYPMYSLFEARQKAMEFLKDVKEGIDVALKIKIDNNSKTTLDEVANKFFELKKQELAENYISKQIARYSIYVKNKIGHLPIDNIDKTAIIDIIKSVRQTKTKSTKNTDKRETSKRVFNLLQQIFRYALYNDYTNKNPTATINLNSIVPKSKAGNLKAITDLKEVQILFGTLKNNYKGYITTVYAVEFLALTALRPGNVVSLKFEWINLQNKCITIPAAKMKNRKDFRLPLTKKLLEIIEELKSINSKNIYIFESPFGTNKHIAAETLNSAHKRIGYENHNAHGWRSAFSTICYELQSEHKKSMEVIEMQLSHKIGSSVKMAYLRSDFLEDRRELLEWWDKKIST